MMAVARFVWNRADQLLLQLPEHFDSGLHSLEYTGFPALAES